MKEIAVLMTVHNRCEKTLSSLDTLFAQTLPDNTSLTVYMTDDRCTDGTPQAVAEKYPHIVIIGGDGELYWNRGMHRAWAEASSRRDYDFYLWLNDDTNLFTNALSTLLAAAYTAPESIIVGATCSSSDMTKVTYSGYRNDKLVTPDGTLKLCNTFNGNVVLVPRTVYQKLGNLDYTYRHAIGDVDYGLSATRAGITNYVAPQFVGICDHNPRPVDWMCADIPFIKRIKNLYSPLGYSQPAPFFHFNLKNHGLPTALRVYISNHIRVCFPKLWL